MILEQVISLLESQASFPKKATRSSILEALRALQRHLLYLDYEQSDEVDSYEQILVDTLLDLDIENSAPITADPEEPEDHQPPHGIDIGDIDVDVSIIAIDADDSDEIDEPELLPQVESQTEEDGEEDFNSYIPEPIDPNLDPNPPTS